MTTHAMDIGGGWTQQSGVWTISGNVAVQATASTGYYIVTTDAGKARCQIHARIRTYAGSGGAWGGVVVRFKDINNYWQIIMGWPSQGVYIVEVVGGTAITRASKTFVTPYQRWVGIDVTCSGDTITATFDGGSTLTYTSVANNIATEFGLFEYRDGSNSPLWFDDFQIVDPPIYPWTRYGTVITPGAGDDSNVLEPTVIYEGNAQILSGNVFKMWCTGGWSSPHINYYESVDGKSWTPYAGNPVLAPAMRSTVLKVGSIYYLYAAPTDVGINQYTSSDGVTWTLAHSAVMPLGASGTWNSTNIANSFIWVEDSIWYMLYDGMLGSGIWNTGLATSSDGITWTSSGSNPVLAHCGGTCVIKVGTYYYLFGIKMPDGNLPSSIVRYRSSNLTVWEPYPYITEISRVGVGEGEDNRVGQVADPFVIVVGNTAYFYFCATADGTLASGVTHLVLATADSRAVDRY